MLDNDFICRLWNMSKPEESKQLVPRMSHARVSCMHDVSRSCRVVSYRVLAGGWSLLVSFLFAPSTPPPITTVTTIDPILACSLMVSLSLSHTHDAL